MTHVEPQTVQGPGFLMGVVAGGILGAALTHYLAPRLTSEVKAQIADAARRLRRDAAAHLEQVSTRLGSVLERAVSEAQPAPAGPGSDSNPST